MYYVGLDIGGTKCALTLIETGAGVSFIEKYTIATKEHSAAEILNWADAHIKGWLDSFQIKSIGISCGGPLDSARGVILNPPNLPGWENLAITERFNKIHHIPAYLENDANASAVAEWKYGAGKGAKNLIFLTFGTGMGAGVIIDSRLYRGANGNAGEIGHVRLARNGQTAYGKRGSVESFCSGSGIEKHAKAEVKKLIKRGLTPALMEAAGSIDNIDAKLVADLAIKGDPLSISLYKKCGRKLGETLAVIIDLFNPELIIIGGIFMRSAKLIIPEMEKAFNKEALPESLKCCRIAPAGLSENIGDFAALAAAQGE